MKGPQGFLFKRVRPHHLMTDTQEFFVRQHPPSSCDDRSTRCVLVSNTRYTVITWWKVHKSFVQEGPPSSPDDRSTRIFCLTTSTLIVWWRVHKNFWFPILGTPSSHDDRSARIFVREGPPSWPEDRYTRIFWTTSTIIAWWQVRKNFLFPILGTPSLHDERSTRFFVQEGPPSSPDDRYTRIFCSTTSTLIVWWQVHKMCSCFQY